MQYVLEEGPRDDWFDSTTITVCTVISVVSFLALIIRELSATNPVINVRLLNERTFTAATVIGGVLFAMLMGSMFLLPVFMQELLGFDATQSGVALMPRTLAMMALMPIVGRIYNKVPPAIVIGIGGLLFAIGSYMLSHVTLESSSGDIVMPLIVTGFGFAALFIPLTTVSLAHIERKDLADAAGLSSFVRQIGGSVGLTIFATLLDHYQKEAYSGVASHVSLLRPEVTRELAAVHGSVGMFAGRAMMQSAVLSFERVFLLQAVAFIVILPLLFFLRAEKHEGEGEPAHVELPME
jgi:DHA2 family multidrug resistance protein